MLWNKNSKYVSKYQNKIQKHRHSKVFLDSPFPYLKPTKMDVYMNITTRCANANDSQHRQCEDN